MFLQCCFQKLFCSILFPNLDRYSAFWKYVSSSLLSNNPTFIKTSERMFGDSLTLDDLGQAVVPLEFRIFFCLKKPCLSFFLDKVIKNLVLLIFSGGDCVGAFILEPHLTQYLSCSPSSSPHEGQKCDMLPSILN